MSGRPKADVAINRLLDMVVEEVSLVDRAANKHRFLIVKRSDEMDETTTDTTTSQADEANAETNPSAGSSGDTPADGVSDPSNDATSNAPLAVAVAALEGLTETVELLGTLGEEEAKPKLAELATELRGVSERLAQAAGGSTSGGGDGDTQESASDGPDAGDSAKDGADFAQVLEAVRATLERVGSLMDAQPGDAGADAAGDNTNSGDGSDGDGVAEQLTELLTELRALTGAVKEQQQRLTRLEKRSGLPNSAPSGEQRTRPEGEDVGWPLDLNRPYDRESVDKATSFHDV
jgi:hypothetical protein